MKQTRVCYLFFWLNKHRSSHQHSSSFFRFHIVLITSSSTRWTVKSRLHISERCPSSIRLADLNKQRFSRLSPMFSFQSASRLFPICILHWDLLCSSFRHYCITQHVRTISFFFPFRRRLLHEKVHDIWSDWDLMFLRITRICLDDIVERRERWMMSNIIRERERKKSFFFFLVWWIWRIWPFDLFLRFDDQTRCSFRRRYWSSSFFLIFQLDPCVASVLSLYPASQRQTIYVRILARFFFFFLIDLCIHMYWKYGTEARRVPVRR